jgi:hypothetical protein
MNGRVLYYDPAEKKVKEMEIELELKEQYESVTGWYFWAEGRCPFDNEHLSFDIVLEDDLSAEVYQKVRESGSKRLKEMVDDLLYYHKEPPSETSLAGYCIHFSPRGYEGFVEESEILVVQSGLAFVDADEVVRALLEEKLGK